MSPSTKLSIAIGSVITGALIALISFGPDLARAQTDQDPANPFNTPADDVVQEDESGVSDPFVVPDPFGEIVEDESSASEQTETVAEDPFGNVIEEGSTSLQQTEAVDSAATDPFGNVIQESTQDENSPSSGDPFGDMADIEVPDPFGQINSLSSDPSETAVQPDAFGPPPSSSYNPASSLDRPPVRTAPVDVNANPPAIPDPAPVATEAPVVEGDDSAFSVLSPTEGSGGAFGSEPAGAGMLDPQPITPPEPATAPPTGEPRMRDISPPFSRGNINFPPTSVPRPSPVESAVAPAAAVTTQPVSAQPGPRTQSIPTGDESGDFAGLFHRYLEANNYRNWSPAPGSGDRFNRGSGPHEILNKLYMNRSAVTSIDDLPYGSVIVMENYASDRSLISISAMMKSDRFNPRGGDWFWVEYDADGNVISDEVGIISGRLDSCIQCHSSAGGDDFIFSNDR
ncbi:MAG: cytochrome P460 family protein [Planctomycetota bacterium]